MEYCLFDYLREHAGQLCTNDAIWESVWVKQIEDPAQTRHLIQVTISRLK
jgi:DNA-binding response OmpR family regulator